MAWLLTQIDPWLVFAWCTLPTAVGRPLMAFVGFGGLIATIRSLWTLPKATNSDVVTLRNRQRRYRNRTIIIGWVALVLFAISSALYVSATSGLRAMGKICEMDHPPCAAAKAILPFLLVTTLAVISFAWLQTRALRLKG